MEKTNLSRSCYSCSEEILTSMEPIYQWEMREFCSSTCLGTCTTIEERLENCGFCKCIVNELAKIKLCVRFGSQFEQFCSHTCLDNYKMSNSFCKLCQEKIISFMVISEEEKFCSPFCVSRYSGRGINQLYFGNENACYICEATGVHHLEMLKEVQSIFFCSRACIVKYSKEEAPIKYVCSICGCLLLNTSEYFYKDGVSLLFCSRQCSNIHIITESQLVNCCVCQLKKFSFDMIKMQAGAKCEYFCSMMCLWKKAQSESMEEHSSETSDPSNAVLPTLKVRSACELNEEYIELDTDHQTSSAAPVAVVPPSEEVRSGNEELTVKDLEALKSRFFPETVDKYTGTSKDTRSFATQSDSSTNTEDKNMQTDKRFSAKVVPVPFPVYIPTPVPPFAQFQPTPMIIPIPIPIPIPVPLLSKSQSEEASGEERESIDQTTTDDDDDYDDDDNFFDYDDDFHFDNNMDEPVGPCSISGISNTQDDKTEDSHSRVDPTKVQPQDQSQTETAHSNKSQPGKTYLINEENFTSELKTLNETKGMVLWNRFISKKKNDENFMKKISSTVCKFEALSNYDKNLYLVSFMMELTEEKEYHPSTIIYVLLCIQKYLSAHTIIDSFFMNICFQRFAKIFYLFLQKYLDKYSNMKLFLESCRLSSAVRISEDMLWDSYQLGSLSPSVLLYTVLFFNTKFFKFDKLESHETISFKRFLKYSNTKALEDGTPLMTRSLRYICVKETEDQKKLRLEMYEDVKNPFRCPVKINEFYASKCPTDALLSGNFYFTPILGCCAESKLWFSSRKLPSATLRNMLNFTLMVEEVQQVLSSCYP